MLKLLGYNPRLIDKKLILVAKKPLLEIAEIAQFPRLCGSVQKVRTPDQTKFERQLNKLAANPALLELAEDAKLFMKDYDPQALVSVQSLSDNHTIPTA